MVAIFSRIYIQLVLAYISCKVGHINRFYWTEKSWLFIAAFIKIGSRVGVCYISLHYLCIVVSPTMSYNMGNTNRLQMVTQSRYYKQQWTSVAEWGRGAPWPCLKLRCERGREFNPRPGQYIVGWVFHPARWLVRFSHLNMYFLQHSEFI